jgi:hypothetical protein
VIGGLSVAGEDDPNHAGAWAERGVGSAPLVSGSRVR